MNQPAGGSAPICFSPRLCFFGQLGRLFGYPGLGILLHLTDPALRLIQNPPGLLLCARNPALGGLMRIFELLNELAIKFGQIFHQFISLHCTPHEPQSRKMLRNYEQ
ncbi:MAG: hypothetical protein P8X90_25395 [Desulfobacterales bacterium]